MTRTLRTKRWLCLFVMALWATVAVQARADNDIKWKGEVNGWTFRPAIAQNRVVGFLGWATTATITGDNIAVVWLQREAGDAWSTWAWKSGNFAKAVDSIRTSLAQPTLWVAESDVTMKLAALPPVTEPEAPTALLYGLFTDDPVLQAVTASPDPVNVVKVLSDLGWYAAPTISALTAQKELTANNNSCDPLSEDAWTITNLANRMTYESETAMFGQTTLAASRICIWGLICQGCWWYTTNESDWGPWECNGSTTLPSGVVLCHYKRQKSRWYSPHGAEFWFCANCAGIGWFEYKEQTGDSPTLNGVCDCTGNVNPNPTGTGDWE